MSDSPTQAGRLLQLSTPLGPDVLLAERLTGSEEISGLFRFEVEALCPPAKAGWAFADLLGQSVTAKLEQADGSFRYFNGIVSRVRQGGSVAGPDGRPRRYRLEIVPKAWLLTLTSRSRIFEAKSVPDILAVVLADVSPTVQLTGTFEPRDYCVQYQETDWAFACRLMEEEGIFFYFKHADGSHAMVIGNDASAHAAVPGNATIPFRDWDGGVRPKDGIRSWDKHQQIRPGKVTLRDHSFELAQKNLEAVAASAASASAGTASHALTGIANDATEVYEFPGRYADRFDGVDRAGGDKASEVQKIFTDNKRTAAVRMKQLASGAVTIDGEGGARQLCAGHTFTLADHDDGDGEYLVVRVEHDASQEGTYFGGDEGEPHYDCRFRCVPKALPFAPPLVTPRPLISGPQTAVVVGQAGDEIFTDKYGRVKVQFHWHREGKNDPGSSCWVRVSSLWAGKQWGGVWIPRVGHEVVVAFEEGNPDRPLVVGSVYNADNMPPYTLPDNKTLSGIKSRSSLDGTAENFNELRFEDKKDSEHVYFHAERDFTRIVENNDVLKVGFEKRDKGNQDVEIFNNRTATVGKKGDAAPEDGSETLKVYNNQTETIGYAEADAADGSRTTTIFNNDTLTVGSGKGDNKDGSQTVSIYKNRTVTIETGNDVLAVKQGNRAVTVETGDEALTVKTGKRDVLVETGHDTHTVKTGNREVSVDTGNDTLTVKTGNHTTTVTAGKCVIEAGTSIELKVGGASIKIEPAKITIKAPQVMIQGDGQVQVKAPMTQVNGDGTLILKGGVTMIN